MRRHTGTAVQLSPIARKQRQLAGLGYLGAAGASVWSGPPVGEGAGKGAETGAVQGASLGTTIMPGIGTAIGLVVGAIGGAIAGAIGKQDPEIQNFNQAIALWQQNPDAIYKLANKYLVLAGFFDLTSQQAGRIRIYRKYGRMGEEPFTRDLTAQIYQAAQTGAITPQDSAQSIYQKVILPWEDSWGFGPEPSNPHSDFMDRLLTGMILDYATGYGPKNWFSRSGPLPASFSSIPPFQFPVVAAAPTSSAVSMTTSPGAAAPQMPPFPGWSSTTLPGAGDVRLTVPWTLSENGYTAPMSPAGGNNLYTIQYPDGAAQFQWALAGNQVIGLRKSPNGWGKYTGTIAPDGITVSGSASMITTDHPTGWTYAFNALINAPAQQPAQPMPSPAPVPVTPPIESKTQAVTPPPTAVSVPTGFVLVGTANNLQVYVGPDGMYYSWSGTNMTPLTGVLTGTSGVVANVVNGQIQATPTATPTPTAQSQPQIIYTPSPAPVPDYSTYTPPTSAQVVAAPTAAPAATGGVPTWAWLGAGVAALYIVMGNRRRA